MSASRIVGSRELRGIMLPVGTHNMLLPNAAVAELIGYQEPESEADKPDWWLGRIDWRGMQIPVVSMEMALGLNSPQPGRRTRIAVLNTLNGNAELPYLGVLSIGISRLARVSAANLIADPQGRPDSALIMEAVYLGEQEAWIPDLDALERLVVEAG